MFVTGEYGDKNKRPHWHAIVFNWAPCDGVYFASNVRGDKRFSSKILSETWGHGIAEFGNVTIHSAGYCARYAAKKLTHGKDGSHDYHPISKKSSKHAIGKRWLEKYYKDVFNQGHVVLPDGQGTCPIPRYYERWFKETHPTEWLDYVTHTKTKKIEFAALRAERERQASILANYKRHVLHPGVFRGHQTTRFEAQRKILRSKFKMLQDYLKL